MSIHVRAAKRLHTIEITGLAGDLHHPLHRASDHNDLAVGSFRSVSDGAQPRHVGCECRHRDAPARRFHEFGDVLGDFLLGRRAALTHGVGRIADQRHDAFIADFAQPLLVGRLADDRRRIDLPVTGMQHCAGGRADRERMGFGNRVRDRNEFHAERADVDGAARRHDCDRDLWRVALAGAFGFEQRRAELRRVDRALQLRPQIDDGTEMILVGMGQNQTHQILPLLHQKADVRHDDVDARQMLLVTERHAEIDGEPASLVPVAEAVDRQVHADLADTSQRCKRQFVRSRHQVAPDDLADPK